MSPIKNRASRRAGRLMVQSTVVNAGRVVRADQETSGEPESAIPDLPVNPDMDPARLLRVCDASLGVRLRHQFFAWTQGAVQGMLPHDGLICVLGDTRTGKAVVDFFTTQVVTARYRDIALRPHEGLSAELTRRWMANGCRPLICGLGGQPDAAPDSSRVRFVLPPFQHASIHGIAGLNRDAMGLFVFLYLSGEDSARQPYVLELLVPHLFSTWSRVQAEQPAVDTPRLESPRDLLLTERQIEIMNWVRDGKSNIEIGLILGISALTVKNHVQKILHRLNVHNRAQAVAKCLSMNLLKSRRQR